MTVRRWSALGWLTGAVALASMAPSSARAQTASISGTVLEVASRQPIEDATITIEGTTLGARSRANGTYTILGVPPGNYTVIARRLGY